MIGSVRLPGLATESRPANVLDAAGNVLKTVRIGTGRPQITLSQAAYDLAGRATSPTEPLQWDHCLYQNVLDGSGQAVKTNSYPDGGTRIETYYQDGSLKCNGTRISGRLRLWA